MTTTDATYLIAHQNGIMLDRYLSPAEVDRVRMLIPGTKSQAEAAPRRKPRHEARIGPEHRTIVIGSQFKGTDPILPSQVLNEAKEMAAIYPLLYVIENSIREAIQRVMRRCHGDNWWDTQAPQGLRDAVEKRMNEENINSWHQRRGAHPIYYLDLIQLPALVRKNERHFIPDIFPSVDWFTHFIDELYLSRCVLAHMNPLDRDNLSAVKLSFNRWQKLVNNKKASL